MPKQLSENVKTQILKDIHEGLSTKELIDKHKISQTTVHRLRQLAKTKANGTEVNIKSLIKRLRQLESDHKEVKEMIVDLLMKYRRLVKANESALWKF